MKWTVERDRFDEIFERTGRPRPHYRSLVALLRSFTPAEIERRERLQKLSLMNQGIPSPCTGRRRGSSASSPSTSSPASSPPASGSASRTGSSSGSRPSTCSSWTSTKGIYRGNARETLEAEIHTRPSAHKGVSTLHEETQQIDLPVYQEIPERHIDRAALLLAEEAAAQQQ